MPNTIYIVESVRLEITNEIIQNHFPFDINDFGIEVEVDAKDSGPTSKVTREKKTK